VNASTTIGPVEDTSAQLARYGIRRVSTDHFTVGDYRYGKIEDAVAEARRRLAGVGEGS
jgi:hypothetical protein